MISVGWGNQEETILIFRIVNQYNKEEYITSIIKLFNHLCSKDHPVHILLDLQNSINFINDFLKLIRVEFPPEICNGALLIVIKRYSSWADLCDAIKLHYKHNAQGLQLHFVDTAEDAYQLLADHGVDI